MSMASDVDTMKPRERVETALRHEEPERALGEDMLLTSVGWTNSYYLGDQPYVDEWGVGWAVQPYQTPFGTGHYTEIATHPLADDQIICRYRTPIRFMAQNAFLDTGMDYARLTSEERRVRWFDIEYQVDLFERSLEGRLTADPLHTFGGCGVVQIPRFQALLRHICANGYEHHVAVNHVRVADALDEALTKYMGWDIYHHQEGT
jgi:hypothetical protein